MSPEISQNTIEAYVTVFFTILRLQFTPSAQFGQFELQQFSLTSHFNKTKKKRWNTFYFSGRWETQFKVVSER